MEVIKRMKSEATLTKEEVEQVITDLKHAYGCEWDCKTDDEKDFLIAEMVRARENSKKWDEYCDTFVPEYEEIFSGIERSIDRAKMRNKLNRYLRECTCYPEKERKARRNAMLRAYRNGEPQVLKIGVMTCNGENGIYTL